MRERSGFFLFVPIPNLNGYDLLQLVLLNCRDSARRTRINPIPTEWTSEKFIIDFVMRDKAEAFVTNALALGNFFIIVAITHVGTHFQEREGRALSVCF